jgi:hypothetical protein
MDSDDDGREARLEWCRQRAMEFVNDGNLPDAVASFSSDLVKHVGTRATTRVDYLGRVLQAALAGRD